MKTYEIIYHYENQNARLHIGTIVPQFLLKAEIDLLHLDCNIVIDMIMETDIDNNNNIVKSKVFTKEEIKELIK